MNKVIRRDTATTTKIFDDRTLDTDYSTLVPLLEKGLRVLDVGCGTGAISRGIAERVGEDGHVVGIDNTEAFIVSGKETYGKIRNLELIHADLFTYHPEEKFDLVVAARLLQWLKNPKEALRKFATFLKPGGQISVLDYNHEGLIWRPQPPESMRQFYKAFLHWRADAGMDNRVAEHLESLFNDLGFHSVHVLNADEVYNNGDANFRQRVGIWAKVAELRQIVEEGYLDEAARIRAIDEYSQWVETEAECMVMKLKDVRAKI